VRGQPPGFPAAAFLEGPSFDRDGNLWCVDIPNGRILTVDAKGQYSVVTQYDGWPNGLKIHRDGRVFIADYKHGIMVLDPETKRVKPFLERANVERFKGVNDLFFAPDFTIPQDDCFESLLKARRLACSTTCLAPMDWS
jgi:gluconolactonase